jgi:hypothetical protein
MRRTSLIVLTVASLLLISAFGQSRKRIEVTAPLIASQRGKPYVIDLNRKATTYTVTADVASHVRIRTAGGEMAMTDLMSKLGITDKRFLAGSKFLIGTQSDLRAVKFGRPSVTRPPSTAMAQGITCNPVFCECDPDIEGDCFGRKALCLGPMVCYVCNGPECPPERRYRWTCVCAIIPG